MKNKDINKPFFSIITCTYNSEKFIERNIKSVEIQTYANYEHVIIDGQSTDKTRQILARKKRHELKIFEYPPKGISNAHNLGIKRSIGKYIIHLNSDDYFSDEKVLEDVYEYLINNKCLDWIYGDVQIVDLTEKKMGKVPQISLFKTGSYQVLKLIDYIPHQGVFIRRRVFDKYGLFDEKIKLMSDYEYWLRIAQTTKHKHFERTISNYTAWPESRSIKKDNLAKAIASVESYHPKYCSKIEHKLYMFLNYGPISKVYRWWRYYK